MLKKSRVVRPDMTFTPMSLFMISNFSFYRKIAKIKGITISRARIERAAERKAAKEKKKQKEQERKRRKELGLPSESEDDLSDENEGSGDEEMLVDGRDEIEQSIGQIRDEIEQPIGQIRDEIEQPIGQIRDEIELESSI